MFKINKVNPLLWIFVVAALILLLCVLEARSEDYSVLVPANTSYKVVPERGAGVRSVSTPWAKTNAVVQGSVALSSSKYYMAIHAGTTGTNTPVHITGIVNDGGVDWLRIYPSDRNVVVITQEGSGGVWYHANTASTNGGVFAFVKGQAYIDEANSPVYVWCEQEMKLNIKDR